MLIHYPPQLSKQQERVIKRLIDDWSVANGLCMRTPDRTAAVHAPVTMFPSPFSKSGFEEAVRIQTAFNELYIAVSQHPHWLLNALDQLIEHDHFTRRLVEIYKTVEATERTQRLTGGLFRSDYMVNRLRTNDTGRQIKQVEFNTISVSFGGLSTRVTQLHKYLASTNRGGTLVHGDIPQSPSLTELAHGLAAMHHAYVYAETHHGGASVIDAGSSALTSDDEETADNSSAITPGSPRADPPIESIEHHPESSAVSVLVIVQPGETNVMDQRLVEFELFNNHHIVAYRLTLAEVEEKLSLTENNRLVFLPTGNEISVVYYRAGYGPDDYPTELEWNARLMLEKSHAINCPSIITQLSGAKKVQQMLTDPSILSELVPHFEPLAIEKLLKTFVDIYPLDNSPRGLEGIRLAMESPENFVLKPQREGGGHNIYREDIPAFLHSMPREAWSAYVLMELIEPPRISNKIVRNGEVISGRVVNELGIFGTAVWDIKTGTILRNEQAGWLLRTKLQSSDEGGIAAGFGCLDSVLLNAR